MCKKEKEIWFSALSVCDRRRRWAFVLACIWSFPLSVKFFFSFLDFVWVCFFVYFIFFLLFLQLVFFSSLFVSVEEKYLFWMKFEREKITIVLDVYVWTVAIVVVHRNSAMTFFHFMSFVCSKAVFLEMIAAQAEFYAFRWFKPVKQIKSVCFFDWTCGGIQCVFWGKKET